MRWLARAYVGMVMVTVGYVLLGLMVYDFNSPTYHSEGPERLINEHEYEGHRYWTRVEIWRFTSYDPGCILGWIPGGWDHSRIYNRIEPVFRPLTWTARRRKAHPYRAEWHVDQSDNPSFLGCSRSDRWEVLGP